MPSGICKGDTEAGAIATIEGTNPIRSPTKGAAMNTYVVTFLIEDDSGRFSARNIEVKARSGKYAKQRAELEIDAFGILEHLQTFGPYDPAGSDDAINDGAKGELEMTFEQIMYEKLLAHQNCTIQVGIDTEYEINAIEIANYHDGENVAIECTKCNEVIIDFDKPNDRDDSEHIINPGTLTPIQSRRLALSDR
jgi:hypothetical protein